MAGGYASCLSEVDHSAYRCPNNDNNRSNADPSEGSPKNSLCQFDYNHNFAPHSSRLIEDHFRPLALTEWHQSIQATCRMVHLIDGQLDLCEKRLSRPPVSLVYKHGRYRSGKAMVDLLDQLTLASDRKLYLWPRDVQAIFDDKAKIEFEEASSAKKQTNELCASF